ncbi:MAG: hypothetical protein U9P72_02725 [Campylobacterota bacterium]|nr:hypothetical protein [Campylobacterota bacterium]
MRAIKLLLVLHITVISLYADLYDKFSINLRNKDYPNACKVGKKIFFKGEKDEKLLSIIGQVCLKADYIYITALIQSRLRTTEDARTNAVVFSSILLQKRLIYQFMYDDVDISSLSLPVSEHPLSHTFTAIRDKNYTLVSKYPKIIEFRKNHNLYKVSIDYTKRGKIIIEISDIENKKTIHRYL